MGFIPRNFSYTYFYSIYIGDLSMNSSSAPFHYDLLENYFKKAEELRGFVVHGEDTERCVCRIDLISVGVVSKSTDPLGEVIQLVEDERCDYIADLEPTNGMPMRRGVVLKRTAVVRVEFPL
jgi:hypothetical protein